MNLFLCKVYRKWIGTAAVEQTPSESFATSDDEQQEAKVCFHPGILCFTFLSVFCLFCLFYIYLFCVTDLKLLLLIYAES